MEELRKGRHRCSEKHSQDHRRSVRYANRRDQTQRKPQGSWLQVRI